MRGWPACVFSADGRRFVLAGWYRATIHDGITGKRVGIINDFEHEDLPSAVAISPTGGMVAVGAQSSGLRLWDLAHDAKLQAHIKHYYTEQLSITFAPDGGDFFLPGYSFESAGVWSTKTGKQRWAVPEELDDVRGGRFERDGTIWFFSGGHKEVNVHRLELPQDR
jgi:WD40 repeat protein